jgi:Signal transduction histidine kinase
LNNDQRINEIDFGSKTKGGIGLLFLAMVFLIFALFVMVRVFRGYPAMWLGLILFTFGCCIIGLAGLIPRFGNYQLEGILNLPLNEPSWVWHLLSNLSLYDFMRFRLWTAIGFTTALVCFAYAYSFQYWKFSDIFLIAIFVLTDGWLLYSYDPLYLSNLYIKGAAYLSDPVVRIRWERGLLLQDWAALGLIVIMLFWAVRRIFTVFINSKILQKRVQALCVGIGSLILAIFFILLFCFGRSTVLSAYTMATTLLPLGPQYPVINSFYILAVPLVTIIAVSMVLLAILRYGFLGTSRIGTKKLEQQISVANQAVRLALHSFKNRFLAVQMAMNMAMLQLDALRGEEVSRAGFQIKSALDVCAEALAGLDKLHAQAKSLQVNPRWVSLQELIEEALHHCNSALTGTVVTKRYPNSKIMAWGDREHLVTVLENLLQNAIDAMADRLDGEEMPKLWIEIGVEYEWGFIRIGDNGAGISKANLHKVFRPFFTTKPSKSNWGLGLTYCHRVIKTHRGFINLRSKSGVGTTVEVVLRCRENVNIFSRFWEKMTVMFRKSRSMRS